MGEAKRKTYTAAFKAKVGLEAIRGVKTVNEIGQEYGVHPAQVGQWKKEIQERAESLFGKQRGPKPVDGPEDKKRLYSEIGRLKVELDWLKKVRTEPVSVRRECELAGVVRSWVYGPRAEDVLDERDLELLRLIDAEYTRRPFYGSRRMVISLGQQRHTVNRKRVQRLMRVLGLVGMGPGRRPAGPTRSKRSPPTCCGAWRSCARTRFGAVTSLTSAWSMDLPT